MRKRRSLAPTTPSPPQTLRRSPRFLNNPLIDHPKYNPNSSKNEEVLGKESVKKDAILRSGLRRSQRLNKWVGASQALRRSPRFCGEKACEDSKVVSRNVVECGGEEGLKESVRGPGGGDETGRTRNVGDEESNGSCLGWTREQELALEKAYFAAEPTPHFWKKVSRMVPGKSAQDCFDKVNASQLTPVQRPPRSRARKTKSSSPALSASKLLAPNHAKSQRLGCNKKISQLAHKTVREILEKQCRVRGHEIDLFLEFEPDVDPSIKTSQARIQPSTPYYIQQNREALKKVSKKISSGQRNPFSSVNSLTGSAVSPPVLKQVKNKALHEKYIDVLRKREAKRKAFAAKEGKVLTGKENKEGCYKQNIDVRAAKNALVSGARDAISQLKSLRDNATKSSSDLDDDLHIDDDEGEDEL